MREGVEWAAHCTVLLALLPSDATLPAVRLADYHGVPAPYLAKSLQALARSGIVESASGRNGGYRLARPATATSLLDVVDAVEGDRRAFRCTEIRRRGPSAVPARCYTTTCTIAAEDTWRHRLGSVSIAELAAAVATHAPADAAEKAATWLSDVLARRSGGDR